jgi:ATP-dependent RNA helicase MSS116
MLSLGNTLLSSSSMQSPAPASVLYRSLHSDSEGGEGGEGFDDRSDDAVFDSGFNRRGRSFEGRDRDRDYGGRDRFGGRDGGFAGRDRRPRTAEDDAPDHRLNEEKFDDTEGKQVETHESMRGQTFQSMSPPISQPTLKAIHNVLKFKNMTHVQQSALPHLYEGKDALVKAKTGSGKTIAFLLPAVDRHFGQQLPRDNISTLVITPNRELANQIYREARQLIYYHDMGAQVLVGGMSGRIDQRILAEKRCDIIIATPGRLQDHLENTRGFAQRIKSLKTLILDEADYLLDVGFKHHIDSIVDYLPKDRQTCLFSATLTDRIRDLALSITRPDSVFIDTVGKDTDTNYQVVQEYAIVPGEKQFSTLFNLIKEEQKKKGFKILVFFPTVRQTELFAKLFNQMGVQVREIHSGKTQPARTQVAQWFRNTPQGILFSSDVSGRGVDYPDISLVIQVGAVDRKKYIHRVGRTARAGKEGRGILLLNEYEKANLTELRDIPINKSKITVPTEDAPEVRQLLERVQKDFDLKSDIEGAFGSYLGHYKGQMGMLGWSNRDLLRSANSFAHQFGVNNPRIPGVFRELEGVEGARFRGRRDSGSRGDYGGGFGSRNRDDYGGGDSRDDYGRRDRSGRDWDRQRWDDSPRSNTRPDPFKDL